MIEEELKRIIPSEISVFPKITTGKDPYYFDRWDMDKYNGLILRYWFWNRDRTKKNRKRVFIKEFQNLISDINQRGFLDSYLFENNCPKTLSDGKCGYVVIVRILEFLKCISFTDKYQYLAIKSNLTKALMANCNTAKK